MTLTCRSDNVKMIRRADIVTTVLSAIDNMVVVVAVSKIVKLALYFCTICKIDKYDVICWVNNYTI